MPGFSGLAGVRSFFVPQTSVAFGTAITAFIPPMQNQRTKIALMKYTAAGTAHTVTVLRPLAKTTVKTAAAASATSLVITRDPGNYSANATLDQKQFTPSVANNLIAANDYFLVRKPDNTYLLATCSAATTNADGSVTLTVSALPTGGIAAGADFWFFGITTDTNPNDNKAHPAWAAPASATTTYGDGSSSVVETIGMTEPMMIYSNNATATGTLEMVSGFYGP